MGLFPEVLTAKISTIAMVNSSFSKSGIGILKGFYVG